MAETKRIQLGHVFFFVRVCLFLVALWQIEMIWVSFQNMWGYGLPFGNYCTEYWFWHDFWFVLLFAVFAWAELGSVLGRIWRTLKNRMVH